MEQKDFESAISIAATIHNLLDRAKRNLPYNINVIDELHANENAHSRILCKLLCYQDSKGNYRILDSFIKYIAQRVSSFDSIRINDPIITQEKERIDLWIRDKEYAIILENKVYGANDQKRQLARYIEATKRTNKGYRNNQIFIVYLPADNNSPSDNSWDGYENEFDERYANISFKNDIIPWLKNDVLPHCTIREEILISAIEQYIDYLEGLFRLRLSQQKYYHMETEWLTQIGIQGETFAEQLVIIDEIKKQLVEAQDILDCYRNEKINDAMKNFNEISMRVLGDNWKYTDSISDGGGWHLLYDTRWNTGSCVHIEWSSVSIKDLFVHEGKCDYLMVLHVEREYRHNSQYLAILRKHLGKYYRPKNRTTFWYTRIESDKPIGNMSEDEMYDFFQKAYCTGEVRSVIEAVTLAAEEYHRNK